MRARWYAICSPMPLLAPVTITRFPRSISGEDAELRAVHGPRCPGPCRRLLHAAAGADPTWAAAGFEQARAVSSPVRSCFQKYQELIIIAGKD